MEGGLSMNNCKVYVFDLPDGTQYGIFACSETEARLRVEIDTGLRDMPLLEVREPVMPLDEAHLDENSKYRREGQVYEGERGVTHE
jgi:hypothetical protein